MDSDLIILIVQAIAALGVSVVYLGIQIHQQNEIQAQFGHSLTQRQIFCNG